MGLLFNGGRVSVLQEEPWRCTGVTVAQRCECAQCHRTVYLKVVKIAKKKKKERKKKSSLETS